MNYQIYNDAMLYAEWYAMAHLESAKVNGGPKIIQAAQEKLDQIKEARIRMRAAVKVLEDEDSYAYDENPIEQAIDLFSILS